MESSGGVDHPAGGSVGTLGSGYPGVRSRERSTGGYQGQLVLAEVTDAMGVEDQFGAGGTNEKVI